MGGKGGAMVIVALPSCLQVKGLMGRNSVKIWKNQDQNIEFLTSGKVLENIFKESETKKALLFSHFSSGSPPDLLQYQHLINIDAKVDLSIKKSERN